MRLPEQASWPRGSGARHVLGFQASSHPAPVGAAWATGEGKHLRRSRGPSPRSAREAAGVCRGGPGPGAGKTKRWLAGEGAPWAARQPSSPSPPRGTGGLQGQRVLAGAGEDMQAPVRTGTPEGGAEGAPPGHSSPLGAHRRHWPSRHRAGRMQLGVTSKVHLTRKGADGGPETTHPSKEQDGELTPEP